MQQYLGFTAGAGYGQFEHKADSLIANSKEAAEQSERLMYEQSHRDYPALVICIIVCLSWAVNHYRDNAVPQKLANKNAREYKLANAAITDMQMRQRDVAALDAKYTKELADAFKAENDALRDDVAAGRRRLHIKAVCQSVREATTASGVDNATLPPTRQTPLNGIISPAELITMQKQLEGTQSILSN